MAYKQPENVEAFLVEQVKNRKDNGSRSIVYTDQELQNIFTLYDLKGAGHITKDQCREALKTLANSEFHFTKAQEAVIPTKVDLFTFMKVCDDVLGIKGQWALGEELLWYIIWMFISNNFTLISWAEHNRSLANSLSDSFQLQVRDFIVGYFLNN